jgi:hypothetical protein
MAKNKSEMMIIIMMLSEIFLVSAAAADDICIAAFKREREREEFIST